VSSVLERIQALARRTPRRLVLVEGEDARVARAAGRLAAEGLAQVTLLGAAPAVRAGAQAGGVVLDGVRIEDPAADGEVERTAAALEAARRDRMTAEDIARLARDPLFQAAARVRDGMADCFVAGAVRTTADVVRAAVWLIGTAPGVSAVSSFFLMDVPASRERGARTLTFADAGVIPDPTAEQLAEIGTLAAANHERLTGETARVAFLSFSTLGSAEHPKVAKVRRALELARAREPDRLFDGELQADAALDAEVGARKAPGSPVAGRANVLVFPDLDAGNIGYKLVQRLAGARAYGPILQGLSRQANDLSRGCDADDVAHVSTIACALAG
jgi:phosphate acetyltransferase